MHDDVRELLGLDALLDTLDTWIERVTPKDLSALHPRWDGTFTQEGFDALPMHIKTQVQAVDYAFDRLRVELGELSARVCSVAFDITYRLEQHGMVAE